MKARTQTTTRLHASKLARASMASVRVTHSATTHATAEIKDENKRDQFVEQRDKGIFISKDSEKVKKECLRNKSASMFALHTRDQSQGCDSS